MRALRICGFGIPEVVGGPEYAQGMVWADPYTARTLLESGRIVGYLQGRARGWTAAAKAGRRLMMCRFLSPARLMPWILAGLVSLVVLPSPVLAQGTGGQSPVTIIINGTETPDELKKLIDSVSSQGASGQRHLCRQA